MFVCTKATACSHKVARTSPAQAPHNLTQALEAGHTIATVPRTGQLHDANEAGDKLFMPLCPNEMRPVPCASPPAAPLFTVPSIHRMHQLCVLTAAVAGYRPQSHGLLRRAQRWTNKITKSFSGLAAIEGSSLAICGLQAGS